MDEKKFTEWVATLPPTVHEQKLMLAEKNEHERDRFIFFDEKPHLYFLWDRKESKAVDGLVSATSFVHKYFQHFNADEVIAKNFAKWQKDPSSKYHGKTPEEIKKGWEDNGKAASEDGTEMHKQIELFYNGIGKVNAQNWGVSSSTASSSTERKEPIEMIDSSESIAPARQTKEWQHFLKFHEEVIVKNRSPVYRTEWRLFCEQLKLVGTIDCIATPDPSKPSEIIIYDWKRSKEIKRNNPFQRGLVPLQNLEDCNYIHYSLQLNLYKYLLEKSYGFKVLQMAICVFHPNNETYQLIEISPAYDMYINKLVRWRKEELE